jgi:hypothetical protein
VPYIKGTILTIPNIVGVPCCDLPCDFRIKTMLTSSYLYEGLKSYLRYLCLFTYSGVQWKYTLENTEGAIKNVQSWVTGKHGMHKKIGFMVFSAIFNNISAISWRSVLLVVVFNTYCVVFFFFLLGPSWPWSYGRWLYNYLCN